MTKNEAKTLKKGDIIYFLGLNYIINPCKVEEVECGGDDDDVILTFDDGCVQIFGDNGYDYLFLTRKSAIDKAKLEMETLLDKYTRDYEESSDEKRCTEETGDTLQPE